MALILSTKYAGRANPVSVDYPQGSFKNKSAPAATDGTPLEQDWANDIQGFVQSLIASAGITPNNVVDTVGSSQYYDALIQVIQDNGKIATQAEVNAGVVDNASVSPLKLRNLFSINLATNGHIAFPSWLGGFKLQWGTTAAITSGASLAVTLPFAMSNVFNLSITRRDNAPGTGANSFYGFINSPTQITIYNGTASSGTAYWFVLGN